VSKPDRITDEAVAQMYPDVVDLIGACGTRAGASGANPGGSRVGWV